jgi:alpha-L-fucosidase
MGSDMTRRNLMKTAVATAVTAALPAQQRRIVQGPFQPSWESLKKYNAPDWFRDAKFGIWAHWTAQCVPEQGDWYARNMYLQGSAQNKFHVATYGRPSKFGFMEIDNLWKAEKWEPEVLMGRYVKAGAKYFVALANHHDNFDCYNSSHHPWNSVRVGPKKDIVGTWARIARQHGLRFGVTNHSAHAWHWFQTAYGYDPEGDMAGVPYDGFTTKESGKGKWWDGLDPQQLYTGATMPLPKGINSIRDANQWHNQHDRVWNEEPPAGNPKFVETWFLRCQELIDKYQPDLLYFDNTELPLGQTGLDIAAHLYNSSIKRHGKLEAVLNRATGYSSRSAVTGSMLAAFRAGHQLANSTVSANVAEADAKIRGSVALTPYKRLAISPASAYVAASPTTIPTSPSIIPSRTTIPITLPGCAPSATRTPISRVRAATE